MQFGAMLLGEGHAGQHDSFGIIHGGSGPRRLGTDLIGHTALPGVGGFGGIVREGGGDEGRDDTPAAVSGVGQKPPCIFYKPSKRAHEGLPGLDCPFHDKGIVVNTCGRICFQIRKINLSQVFASQMPGVRQVDGHLWLASFIDHDLGCFDDTECRLDPSDNPIRVDLLSISPEQPVAYVLERTLSLTQDCIQP